MLDFSKILHIKVNYCTLVYDYYIVKRGHSLSHDGKRSWIDADYIPKGDENAFVSIGGTGIGAFNIDEIVYLKVVGKRLQKKLQKQFEIEYNRKTAAT